MSQGGSEKGIGTDFDIAKDFYEYFVKPVDSMHRAHILTVDTRKRRRRGEEEKEEKEEE
jgi:hypothetical protein